MQTCIGYRPKGFSGFVFYIFHLLLSLKLQLVQTQPSCSVCEQHAALLRIYEATNGPSWRNNSGWNTSAPCSLTSSGLPIHCFWYGVSCCVMEGYDQRSTYCTRYACNCTKGLVIGLALARNNLALNLMDNVFNASNLEALGCSLRYIFMAGANLMGTVPPELSTLTDLRVLSLSTNRLRGPIPDSLASLEKLEELDLSSNQLTGTLPDGFCGQPRGGSNGTQASPLERLILGNNLLNGTVSMPYCWNMAYLDLQNNLFSGPLPSLTSFRELYILRLGSNMFTGTVSPPGFDLRMLSVLDLSSNLLTGSLPNMTIISSQIAILRVSNNYLTGGLPEELFTLGTLATLMLAGNNITGTLPQRIGEARGLVALQLQTNVLYGTLPLSMRNLVDSYAAVNMSENKLSCCGEEFDTQLLGYRSFDYSKPRLPAFMKLSTDLARPVSDSDGVFKFMRCPALVVNSSYVPGTPLLLAGNASTRAAPSTLDSTGNEDVLGWGLDPEYFLYEGCYCMEGYRAIWEPHRNGTVSMGPRLSCVPVVAKWYVRYPWAVVLIVLGGLLVGLWLTWLSCYRTRGRRSAVVQHYVNMKKRLKGEPLGGQVSIVVTDIEGYSDLMKQSPELMTRALNLHNSIIRKARWGNIGYTVEQEGDSYVLVFYEAFEAIVFCLQTQLALNRQTWPEGLFTADPRDMPSRRRHNGPGILTGLTNAAFALFGGRTSHQGQMPEDRSMSILSPSVRPTGLSTDGLRLDSRQSSVLPVAGRECSTAGGAGFLSMTGGKQAPVMFNGMRVRMGIATGLLPPGSMSKGSAVMDMAKMVSDAANGGQILMDEATLAEVKDRLEELTAVDYNGMNFKKLNAIKPPWYACMRRKNERNPDEALLLDMGEYTYCPVTKRLPLFNLDASSVPNTPMAGASQPPPSTPKGGAPRGKGPERIRLFQVASPLLVGRVKLFGNKLSLKEEWVCSDEPYFAAPGTMDAPLGSVDGPVMLPPITMVFAIVDGGKAFASRFRRDARRVHQVCAACLRACLRCVAGGYLCRMQDGDLKYMVAFSSPQAAVEWSLLLQEVMMYAEWPEAALKFWRDEYDEQGRLVFRGPRMKIGLCEGSPRSIIPDHIGRADYHGASINQAARFMDAAAHGGMIALEAALALKVVAAWQSDGTATAPGSNGFGAATSMLATGGSVSGAPPPMEPRGSSGSRSSNGGGRASGGGSARTSLTDLAGGAQLPDGTSRRMSVVQEGTEPGDHSTEGLHSARRAGAGAGPRPRAPWSDDPAPAAAADAGASSSAKPAHEPAQLGKQAVEAGQQQRPAAGQHRTSGGGQANGVGRPDAPPPPAPPPPSPRPGLLGGVSASRVAPAPLVSTPSLDLGMADGGRTSAGRGLDLWPQTRPRMDEAPTPTGVSLSGNSNALRQLRSGLGRADSSAAADLQGWSDRLPRVEGDPAAWATGARSVSLAGSAPGPIAEGVDIGPDAAALRGAPAQDAASGAAAAAANGSGGSAEGRAAAAAGPYKAARAPPALQTAGLQGAGPDGCISPVTGVALAAAGARDAGPGCAATGPSMTSLASSDLGAMASPGGAALMLPNPPLAATRGSAGDGVGSGAGSSTGPRRPPPLEAIPSPPQTDDDASPPGGPSPSAVSAAVAAAHAAARSDAAVPAPAVLAGPAAGAGATRMSPLARRVLTGPPAEAQLAGRPPGPATRSSAPGTTPGLGLRLGPGLDISGSDSGGDTPPPRRSTGGGFASRPAVRRATSPLHPSGGGSRSAGPATALASPSGSPRASPGPAHRTSRAFSAGAGAAMRMPAPAPLSSPSPSPINRALSAAVSAAVSASAPSATAGLRSPRPPALTPLALPTEKEREEALAASRAAVAESRKIQVDGPADSTYPARVLAHRIGVFRFKGSPEDLHMAHVILEQLAARKFPLDAPKGKGGKVKDGSGLLAEAELPLPDLASRMRERYLLSAPPRHAHHGHHTLDVHRSSPSGRRLRSLLGGHSAGGGGGSGSGANSPTGAAALLHKSRSLMARAAGGGQAAAAAAVAASDGGVLGRMPSGTARRGSGLVSQVLQLASASMRWASGGGAGPEGGPGASASSRSRDWAAAGSASARYATTSGGGDAPAALGRTSPGVVAAAAAVQLTSSTGSVPAPPTPVAAGSEGGASGGGEAAALSVAVAAGPLAGAVLPLSPTEDAGPPPPPPRAADPPAAHRPAIGASPLRHRTAPEDPIPDRTSPHSSNGNAAAAAAALAAAAAAVSSQEITAEGDGTAV